MALRKIAGGFGDVMRAGDGRQFRITFATQDKRQAEQRQKALQRVRDSLVKLGRGDEAKALMLHAAKYSASDDAFDACVEAAGELPASEATEYQTVQQFGEAWTSGELHKLHSSFVHAKKTSDRDAGRLAYLYKVVGAVPLKAFTKKDFIRAMDGIPKTAARPAAKRQYGQVLNRLLNLAVRLDVIALNPVPRGMLPTVKKDKAFTWLYPAEDAKLMACVDVPLEWRALWGFLDREGCRFHEAAGTPWRDLDLDEGTITIPPERTKNGRGLSWDLAPSTVAVLRVLRERTKVGPFEGVDPDEDKACELLQAHLRIAGLTRPALLESTPSRQRLRAHDLRATFITLALLAGRSEGWIMQRTGHQSSGQIHGYDHNARNAARHGQLAPLDVALGLVPAKPAASAVTGNGGEPVTPTEPEGVTEGVTFGAPGAARPPGLANETSMIYAGWPLPGSNRDAQRARDFKPLVAEHDKQKPRTKRKSSTPEGTDETRCHTLNPVGVTAPSESYVDTLRAARRAAAEAEDWTGVARLGELIEAATPKTGATVVELATRRRS